VRALAQRVIGVIAAWAHDGGQVADAEERQALFDELAALLLSQRATFATPVWLNAELSEHPLTSACLILTAEESIPQLLEWNTREGLIFQQGDGAGINLSPILLAPGA
jgi:ribonucleotide reductase alpha subunit